MLQQYEYKLVEFWLSSGANNTKDRNEQLANLGADGWKFENSHIMSSAGYPTLFVLFSRPVPMVLR
jgi:hypothetical protein